MIYFNRYAIVYQTPKNDPTEPEISSGGGKISTACGYGELEKFVLTDGCGSGKFDELKPDVLKPSELYPGANRYAD